MMSQDKEEYEVGIPLDDLSSQESPADRDLEASAEMEKMDPVPSDDDRSSGPEEEDGVGLPSLFDEEELAEVGLKASPFDGEEDEVGMNQFRLDEADAESADESLERQPAEIDSEAEDLSEDLQTPIETGDLAGALPDAEAWDAHDLAQEGDTPPTEPEVDGDAAFQLSPADLQTQLDAIQDQLAKLNDEFTGKLKYDAHKDQIIDKLHQELQEYKQDIVKKHILSIVLDVVKVADDIRKWITYFRSLDVSQRDPVKLFRYLEAIPSDLEDIFYWQGVKPYVNPEGAFNPATQRAIKKIPTDDISKDKTIAKSIRPGYEWEGKVIRQEMVAVYVCEDGDPSVDTRNFDE
jgi:molecular chaperone GrpE (heat shock protein)